MICRECELLLAGEIRDATVEEHLRGCPDCRALAGELRENEVALSAMREEELVVEQALACNGGFSPRRYLWIGAAAAALLLLAFGLSRKPAPIVPPQQMARRPVPETPQPLPPLPAKADRRVHNRPRVPIETAQAEPLLVKMLTPDPDVVIYWLVDPKEKSE